MDNVFSVKEEFEKIVKKSLKWCSTKKFIVGGKVISSSWMETKCFHKSGVVITTAQIIIIASWELNKSLLSFKDSPFNWVLCDCLLNEIKPKYFSLL